MKYKTFVGPQHQKIQKAVCLNDFYGKENPKLDKLKYLWSRFGELVNEIKQDTTNEQRDRFQSKFKAWLTASTQCTHHMT